jgi:general L-amino acid transport system permease protein
MIDEQVPPVAEAGVIRWSEPTYSQAGSTSRDSDIAVCCLSRAVFGPSTPSAGPNAGSLTECREVLFSFYKSTAAHAGRCIEDRIGCGDHVRFRPPELY